MIFASSLLSLISPWAGSPAGRYHRSREPRPPAPPPPPRRHSDPNSTDTNTPQKYRRYSEIRHNKPEIDLRQELLQLNLNNREVDSWLGNKFDEKDEYEVDFRFEHDIPLQRSISLDRGLDIVNYLQTLSECSGSSENVFWTIGSEEVESSLRLEQYRSFEDIPVSPITKSRHVSVDMSNLYGNSSALTVLRESYKGINIDSGRVTPQLRKLQKTYSFKNFDECKDPRKSSEEHLERVKTEVNMQLQPRELYYKSISFEERDKYTDVDNNNVRQRRFGVTMNVWQENTDKNLRKEVLIKQNLSHFKSCSDIYKGKDFSRCSLVDGLDSSNPLTLEERQIKYKGEAINNIRKLRRNFSAYFPELKERNLPKIIVTEVSSSSSVTSSENGSLLDSSNLLEVGRNCNCRICSESEADQKKSFLVRNLHKIFKKIVSYKDYGRNLMYWDENNIFNENEMVTCFVHLLKLLLGLWLRHFDHKRDKLCVASG